MDDDIVAELRQSADIMDMDPEARDYVAKELRAAADEIERLRAEVKRWEARAEVLWGALHIIGNHPNAMPMLDQVRAFARRTIRPEDEQ